MLIRDFVVNIISDWFIEAANHTCGMFDYGVNEMQLSGLTPIPSEQARRHIDLETPIMLCL